MPLYVRLLTCLRCISRSGVLGWVTVGVPSIDFETVEVAVSILDALIGTAEAEEATGGICIWEDWSAIDCWIDDGGWLDDVGCCWIVV